MRVPAAPGTGGGLETTDKEGKISGDTDKASDAGTVMKTTVAGAGIGAIAGRSATAVRASARELEQRQGWLPFCFREVLMRSFHVDPRWRL